MENEQKKGHFRTNWMFYIPIVLLLAFAGYSHLSKAISVKKMKNEMIRYKSEIIEKAGIAFEEATDRNLRLAMKTFVWAVRGEVLRDNLEQVDQFFKSMVKEQGVREVIYVNREGKILLSSNKKQEGQQLAENYTQRALNAEDVLFLNEGEFRIIVAPVLGLDQKAGTLIVVHEKETFKLDEMPELMSPN